MPILRHLNWVAWCKAHVGLWCWSCMKDLHFCPNDGHGFTIYWLSLKVVKLRTPQQFYLIKEFIFSWDFGFDNFFFQECCICLTSYEDGAELHALPCNHHFHSTCIVKWLKMNATCPLCKFNILKGSEQVWRKDRNSLVSGLMYPQFVRLFVQKIEAETGKLLQILLSRATCQLSLIVCFAAIWSSFILLTSVWLISYACTENGAIDVQLLHRCLSFFVFCFCSWKEIDCFTYLCILVIFDW